MGIDCKGSKMKRMIVLCAALAFCVLAAVTWWHFEPTDEPTGKTAEIDAEQATIERTLQRTFRESQTGAEAPTTTPASGNDTALQGASPPPTAPAEPVVANDQLPGGYSAGTYHGIMQRAPRSSFADPELSPNPTWIDADSTRDAILDRAARSARSFTFAVLRVRPDTDLQALNRSLAALGARIEGSTGPHVLARVPADRDRLDTMAGLAGVLGIGAVPPDIKADDEFVQGMLSRSASGQVPVYITLMAEDPAGEWRQALTELGVVVGAYDRDLRIYAANLTSSALSDVLAADFVLSIEPIPVVTVTHDSSVPVMGVDGFRQYDPVGQRFTGTTGSGIAVGVLDTGLNTSHVDIAHGRASICGANFVSDETWDLWLDLHGHGTHVFGTIAAAGRDKPVLAGIAPGLSHLRFGKVLAASGLGSNDDVRRGMDYLSRPTNCAWRGARSETAKPLIVNMSLAATSLTFSGRGVGERKLDSVVHGHSQLYVVAQANAAQHGFSNYGTAKNSLAVGAVEDTGNLARFSSHGPTADGRLVPNVVATGVNLTSARGSASEYGHRTLSGTSMAAPSVAGVAALLMEARPEFRNRPALTRARLMASAVRPHAYLQSSAHIPGDNTDGPGAFNNLYGLGLVSARTTLYSRDDAGGWILGSATSEPENGSYEFIDIEVPEGAGRLDIVLTWDEQPADTLTRSVLNNLDLWADRGADCAEDACGEHASRSEIDNVEWLLIDDPVPGTYRIKVVPVEIYGESSTAAVAWKILRGTPTPELRVQVEDTSPSNDSEYITIDVSVDASNYVASGTVVYLGCSSGTGDCHGAVHAYPPYRSRVYRDDGLSWTDPRRSTTQPPQYIQVGEVAAGTPRRLQIQLRRDSILPGTVINVTASSWNALSAGDGLAIGPNTTETDEGPVVPANDNFSASERIEGATGSTALAFALASREPGEPRANQDLRTLWYTWQAPARGLYRFRVQNAESGRSVDPEFAVFTGDRLVDLDLIAEKQSDQFSFAARAGAVYRLRVASDNWSQPPLMLTWEPNDLRPENDDLAYARSIEGVEGSLESHNHAATLESAEFQGGAAASVWFKWTAPNDGWWRFRVDGPNELVLNVFEGESVGELRLVTGPSLRRAAKSVPARAGVTYRIAVAVLSADESTADFTLHWESARGIGAANDLFDGAVQLDAAEGIVVGESLDPKYRGHYTVEHREPVESGIGTAWWQWTAPSDGRYTWRLDGSPSARLTFFTGDSMDDLQLVGSLDGGSTFILEATAGTRFSIAFGVAPDSISTEFRLLETFTWGRTPANDERVAAGPIVGLAGSTEANLRYATREPNDPLDTVGTDSVWWRWQAPASGWQRFWVEGHPISTIISVYPDDAPAQAIAHSERTLLANGRVEVRVLVEAGQSYDIRLSSRPGVTGTPMATLRWEASDALIALAYKGAVEIDSLAANQVAQGLSSPRNLAISDDGYYLFSTSRAGIFTFVRDPETGELALAYRPPPWPGLEPATDDLAFPAHAPILSRVQLQWNARDDRLLALSELGNYSFALPDDGSKLLSQREVIVNGDEIRAGTHVDLNMLGPDGQYFYFTSADWLLRTFRVDTPEELSLVQTVSLPRFTEDGTPLHSANKGPVGMTFSSDGLYLYLATENGLLVFSRDTTSGELDLARVIPRNNSSDNPFLDTLELTDVSLDGTGALLFVSMRYSPVFYRSTVAVAAFDIATDASNPSHLDTLYSMYVDSDPELAGAPTHVNYLGRFTNNSFCQHLMPHPGRAAVDIFCSDRFSVVAWNPSVNALEIVDFGIAGEEDRFGNRHPDIVANRSGYVQQLAPSPDGSHVYRATSVASGELSDAIHIYERASSRTPADRGDNTGTGVTEPVDDTDETPDAGMAVDCHAGLLVGIGESCAYPGTTDEFSVNERGRASFLGRLAGISIRINNETINGRVYNFEARHQGDGVWRINRVADSN